MSQEKTDLQQLSKRVASGIRLLIAMVESAGQPDPAWADALSDVELALAEVQADPLLGTGIGIAVTAERVSAVTAERLSGVREIQPKVQAWIDTGSRPDDLLPAALALLALFGVTPYKPPALVSPEERGDPRLVSQAISEGINVCHALAAEASIDQPDPQWGAALDSFANAMEATQQGHVWSMRVAPEDVARARQLAALVKRWIDTGQRDDTIATLASETFSAFTRRKA